MAVNRRERLAKRFNQEFFRSVICRPRKKLIGICKCQREMQGYVKYHSEILKKCNCVCSNF